MKHLHKTPLSFHTIKKYHSDRCLKDNPQKQIEDYDTNDWWELYDNWHNEFKYNCNCIPCIECRRQYLKEIEVVLSPSNKEIVEAVLSSLSLYYWDYSSIQGKRYCITHNRITTYDIKALIDFYTDPGVNRALWLTHEDEGIRELARLHYKRPESLDE